MTAAAEGADVAVLRAELARERHLARHDPLTGCLNRRGGEERLAALVPPFALAMIDLDHFRDVNLLPGLHATGDRVLRELADLLAAGSRSDDVLVRWGGEEFLLALAGTDVPGAARRLERFLDDVRSAVVAEHLTVTFSAGVAAVGPTDDLAAAIAAADRALMAAKDAGRARVVTAHLPTRLDATG